jgi:hypothetical protein
MAETGKLTALLDRLHARITRLVWVHGLSTVAGAVAVLLVVAFLLDWGLHVPAGVRVVELALLLLIPVILAVRELVRPLRARPDRAARAVLIERAYPELRQLLVTATEITDPARPAGAVQGDGAETPALRARIVAEAERAAADIEPARALDPRRPRLRFLVGALACVGCAAVLVSSPAATAVFLDRLFLGNTPWPQRTHLTIEIPVADAGSTIPPHTLQEGEPLEIRVARGTDVPVVVRAEGAVPDEVTLHFSGGHRAVLAASGGPVFRTLLRSIQEDTEIHATGGDDVDDDPTVRFVVLRPPDVAGLAIEVEPPAYSGLRPELVRGGDAEVLAGSRIVVHVLPDPADASGRARILPEDRLIDLGAAPFPAPPPAPSSAAGAATPPSAPAPAAGLAFEMQPEKDVRYRIELVDSTGLRNPDPGLFAIGVTEDRAPDVEILSPGRGDFDTVAGGAIALRARVRDDFGISKLTFSALPGSASGAAPPAPRDLPWKAVERSPEDSEREDAGAADRPAASRRVGDSARMRVEGLGRARIEVAELAGAEAAAPGASIELGVTALDNRQPAAREGRSAPVRLRIVSPDEYMRRLQDRLGRARTSAAALGELQRGKQKRTLELLSSLQSDALLSGDASDELFAAATGERRVEGDARSLARELCSALEGVLYARLDEHAAPLLDRLDALLAESDRIFDPEIWRTFATEERASAGTPNGIADRLLAIAALALEVSEVDAPAATRALARAQEATDLARVHAEVTAAEESQKAVVLKIESLLEMLAEWDNYQSILSLTRDILNGQKSLSERTREFAKEH